MQTIQTDIAVIGGGLGGVQAARAACSQGFRVLLCEKTDWIGGQLTSQAVLPDEHRWIEHQGATASYMAYRRLVREHCRQDPAASPLMKEKDIFCPGNSWVSALAHDPRLAHRLLSDSLSPYLKSGMLDLRLLWICVEAEVREDRILSVILQHKNGEQIRVTAEYFLDATDTGDLLPITGTEYRVGTESRQETGEPNASEEGDPEDQQPITWVAALELTGERESMEKPAGYERFSREMVRGKPQLGWEAWGAHGLSRFAFADNVPGAVPFGLWSYRRIQYPPYYTDSRPEISLLNWPQNDYVFGNIIDDPAAEAHLAEARELTRCCVWWLRDQGYPIRFAAGVLGTEDGLAKAPYIRESRRIIARKTILEQEIARAWNSEPRKVPDSVGVGHYAIDIHMTTKSRFTMFEEAQPFEIPLGAMIPVRMTNLLPSSKNIGATHLTGGCFRLHPVEWTVGEAAVYLASFCLRHHLRPAQVAGRHLAGFQLLLTDNGFQLHWSFPD